MMTDGMGGQGEEKKNPPDISNSNHKRLAPDQNGGPKVGWWLTI